MSYRTTQDVYDEIEKRKQDFRENPTNENAIKMLSAEILLLGFMLREQADRIEKLEENR